MFLVVCFNGVINKLNGLKFNKEANFSTFAKRIYKNVDRLDSIDSSKSILSLLFLKYPNLIRDFDDI